MIPGEYIIYGIAILALTGFALVVRSSLRDKGYQSSLPHGQCEVVVGYGHGMQVVCGVKTNHHSGQYWYCSNHPPRAEVSVK